MPFYQKRGEIPVKRHTQFLNDDKELYWEELISRGGFSHIYSKFCFPLLIDLYLSKMPNFL